MRYHRLSFASGVLFFVGVRNGRCSLAALPASEIPPGVNSYPDRT